MEQLALLRFFERREAALSKARSMQSADAAPVYTMSHKYEHDAGGLRHESQPACAGAPLLQASLISA